MNLRSLDLNLLVILDALLDEAHVTRAATRLALSQPATSSALERCRHLFGDRLLERGAGGRMRLTPKAQALREPLRRALAAVTDVVGPAQADLATLRQTVRIVMADLPAALVAAPLYAGLQATAPGIRPVLLPWRSEAEALRMLENDTADIAVSVAGEPVPGVHGMLLLDETYVVAMRAGHPAAAGFDLERWLAHPHVIVSSRGQSEGALDRALAAQGRQRTVGIVVPAFAMVVPLLRESDLIAMVPSRALRGVAGLAVFAPPLAVPGFSLAMSWHARRDRDPGVRHVTALLEERVRAL
ncbi:DNA-binding transcriptional LysR family regulator [Pseudoduganella flava]|uniref:DNA-binding transcriptional LysR family regulator n=1 Tax=Pseudoduganella flava TaxID=871742 RepID=A0A562PEL2_9BURK|nr:LysR family transcriptional regulator [Pseudoduganella flava]QGZ38777.1 LysR family transcriptional regulator [Pseudoduganella flava]TWI42829.1 DNA-binding transcriptional LysR family regulator [Pseudoduganella flava]